MRYSLLILFFISSCAKKKDYNSIEILGHAATGLKIQNRVYHDNTKEGVEFSLSMDGCNGVEIDIQLSKDNQLWLFHDIDLEVETNVIGCISNLQEEDLKNCHYSTLKKERLIKLNELDFDILENKTLMLDIRHANGCENKLNDINEFIKALKNISGLKKSEIKLYILLSINDWIIPFKNEGYNVISSLNNYEELDFNYINYLDGIIIKDKGISKEQIEIIHNQNKKVFIFDIRAPKETRKALSKLPDGLVTDDIRTALIEKY